MFDAPPSSRVRLRLALLLLPLSAGTTGCPPRATPAPGRTEPAATSARADGAGEPNTVLLDGTVVEVKWSDGDTFRISSGDHQRQSARLSGFNTLEDYGPVHRWGSWAAKALFEIARSPEQFLASRSWKCTSTGKTDKYDRLLVRCGDVAEALVGEGVAMVFAIGGPPDARLVELQRAAQAGGKGMWKGGVPPLLLTSVHSAAEGRGYNRVVDTATGEATVRNHQETYATCQEVCEGPAEQPSCMLYVPYEQRYKHQPECLR